MAFFLMYIWGTEKTPAPAMYSRASILAADYLIAVSEEKLSVVCKTDWTALSTCCTEDDLFIKSNVCCTCSLGFSLLLMCCASVVCILFFVKSSS